MPPAWDLFYQSCEQILNFCKFSHGRLSESLLEKPTKELEIMQMKATVLLINRFLENKLYSILPSLKSVGPKLLSAAEDMFLNPSDMVTQMTICFCARSIFEFVVDAMFKHLDLKLNTETKTASPSSAKNFLGNTRKESENEDKDDNTCLTDKILFLKAFLSPMRINAFFELKEIGSTGLHASSAKSVEARHIRLLLIALQEVLETYYDFITSPLPDYGAAPKPRYQFRNTAQNNDIPVPSVNDKAYKTQLCRHFVQGRCHYEERCEFAHGMEQLRKIP